ncbi:hypothetical protein MTO96_037991 [Rhipicephalus appendiculatus]
MADMTDYSHVEGKSATTSGAASSAGGGINWVTTFICSFLLLVLFAGAILLFANGVGSVFACLTHAQPRRMERLPVLETAVASRIPPGGSQSRIPLDIMTRPLIVTDKDGNVITDPDVITDDEIIEYYSDDPPSPSTMSSTTTTLPTKKPYNGPTRKPGLFVCFAPPAYIQRNFTMPDGLCDVMIIGVDCYGTYTTGEYHDLEYDGKFIFDIPAKFPEDEVWVRQLLYLEFFKLVRKAPLAYYGIGVDRTMWRIPQYGPDVNAPFVYVKMVRDKLWPTAQIVYKVEIDNDGDLEYFIHMCKNTTMPDLILLSAHDFFPKPEVLKPVLLPPNILNRPVDYYYMANYGHTMYDAMTQALRILSEGVPRPIVLLLAMFGTKMDVLYPDHRNPEPGRYSIYQPAKYGIANYRYYTNPKLLCVGDKNEIMRKNMVLQEDALTWLAYDKSYSVEMSVAFDKSDTLRLKMCRMFANYTSEPLFANISFGVGELMMDIDSCDVPQWRSPSYERVHMVRAVYNFMAKEYWDPSDLHFCMKVQP